MIHRPQSRCSRWLAVFALCVAGFAAKPCVGGIPAYDAVQVITPGSQLTHLSQFNLDGALAVGRYIGDDEGWAIGIWLPRPLYERPAGYHELYTSPGGFLKPHIDNAGNVNYYLQEGVGGTITLGGATWNATFQYDSLPFPGWNDANVVGREFTTITLAETTSDPVPYENGLGRVTHRDGNIFQPAYEFDYPVVINGGFQAMTRPEGDFGHIVVLNRSGHAVWNVSDINPNVPGRRRANESRWVAVTPTGTHLIQQDYFMNGRGDITYGSPAKILLAEPLGPLGPGVHNQSDIPGMPAGHIVEKMNSSGVFVTWQATSTLTENNVHILSGGKAAPLRGLLPPSVPVASDGMHRSDVNAINEAGMLLYQGVAFENGQFVYTGLFLLTPTLDCDVTLSGTQPYRLAEEFDLDVTVNNVTGAPVTNVRVEGDQPGSLGISVSSGPQFDILSGPTPPGPVTLPAGGTQVYRFHCRAKQAGLGNVTAKVKGTSATGTNLRTQSSAPIEIEQRGDLLIKLVEEPATAFAIDNVYQKVAPEGLQSRQVDIVSDDGRAFEIKVQNDESVVLAYRLFSLETGDTAIATKYFFGTTEITSQIKSGSGWTTPTLAAGGSIVVRMEFALTAGAAAGDSRAALVSLHPVGGSNKLDQVRAEVRNAPPVEVTLRRPVTNGLTPESIDAGRGTIDAPLEFKTDTSALSFLPQVQRGLVADGVTPLLLEVRVPPENFEGLEEGEIEYEVALEIVSGGTLDGGAIDARLGVMQNGAWTNERLLTFTLAQNKLFARLAPIASDDLHFDGPAKELKLRLYFTRAGQAAGEKIFYLRKPPIALVHGYNTGGGWGDAFANTLASSRPRFTEEGFEDFIRTIRYGQDPLGGNDTARENTTLMLPQLVPLLESKYEVMRITFLDRWALTRFDVVAHSQGGVLTRMLCSQNANSFMPLPYRNADNFYRGRFHRVVTIGSPHNGTRIVRYMLALKERFDLSASRHAVGLFDAVAKYFVWNGTAQDKFDPVGLDFAIINRTDANAPWLPDAGAKFHLVQTTVNSGAAPSLFSFSAAEAALGLNLNGNLVLPRGSDGVVDFDSMAATTPEAGQPYPANLFRMSDSEQVSHAFVLRLGADIFGGSVGQVESELVAAHAIAALDQDSALPAGERVFGPFRLPARLPQSVVADIQLAANAVTPQNVIRFGGNRAAARQKEGAGIQSSTYDYEFLLPDGATLTGPITWTAERYGLDGITSTGVSLEPIPNNPRWISVQVDDAALGDVVLYGTATTTDGSVIVGLPVLVSSSEPDPGSYTLSSIEISPASGNYPVGSGVEPELWANYQSNNLPALRLRRWNNTPEFIVGLYASGVGVIDVSDRLSWKFVGVGNGVAYAEWRGKYVDVPFTVYDGIGIDTDSDGMPDDFEQLYFGQPTLADPAADSDGDGASNREEFRAGTSPIDATSVLRIAAIRRQGDDIVVTFPGRAYKRYRLEAASSPASDSFYPVASTPFSDSDMMHEVTELYGAYWDAQRYFRVVVLP